MEKIVIEVDEAIGKKWRLSSQEQKQRLSQEISIRLGKKLMADSKEEFKTFLNEIGATMQQRGLTEEALQEILKEDE